MSHFQQSLTIDATPAAVYAALTTPAGLQGWWTKDSDVDAANQLGGLLQFRFGPHYKQMRVEQLEPGREVRWLCTVAHLDFDHLKRQDEWVGTQVHFHLTPQGANHTRLDFEHIGLVPAFECYDLCQGGWQHFLASLQQYAQTGQGTPHEKALATAQ
ncbi:hypothetical protein IGB42_03364 [Andreprevotia sp. IGB-42]|uniref:SRPBCC family protein n=1 Tax=Andreprevotia sp. IGB-42 TaxID=2497473 RepID=UPI00135C7023|nr:SRPBCC domain-containing protein [Andreprevotia sp. IGB-42]KAF0812087.1 hypothetical protein IGB42_03364 [Andreprevotia sp. IGB-42]